MNEIIEPRNELEKKLVALHQGEIDGDAFINFLIASEVFMPVHEKYQIGGLQTKEDVPKPLIIDTEEGIPVLITFSSPERAKSFVSKFEGYGGGLLAEFYWVLAVVQEGCAISINPDSDQGLDLVPEQVQQIINSVRDTQEHGTPAQ